jgi:hypothetical protein
VVVDLFLTLRGLVLLGVPLARLREGQEGQTSTATEASAVDALTC